MSQRGRPRDRPYDGLIRFDAGFVRTHRGVQVQGGAGTTDHLACRFARNAYVRAASPTRHTLLGHLVEATVMMQSVGKVLLLRGFAFQRPLE